MSIATELTALQSDITAARTAITNMGGTVTVDGGSSQLATDIATIPTGGSDGLMREISQSGVWQIPPSGSNFKFKLPNDATDIGDYGLYKAFYDIKGNSEGVLGLTQVDLSSLSKVSGQRALATAFKYCSNLSYVNLSNLTEVSGLYAFMNTFEYCHSLENISFNSLTSITGTQSFQYCFANNNNITSVSFPELIKIGDDTITSGTDYGHFNNAFYACNSLTTLNFPKLTHIYCTYNDTNGGTFRYNNKITKINFNALQSIDKAPAYSYTSIAQNYIFSACDALAEIHFAAANQAAIEATSGYATKWGAPSGCTIYFDL